jgi:putative transposase
VARPLRIEFPGAVYLVSDTGNRGYPAFQYPVDRVRFLADLAAVATDLHWRIYAWCVLPDRYSFVVETPHGDLATGMRRLGSCCTRYVKQAYGRTGPALHSPYTAILLEPDTWLLPVCRHVVLQPVSSALAAAPEEWLWSSYQATIMSPYVRTEPLDAGALLSHFGDSISAAVPAYADYVLAGIGQPNPLVHVTPYGILGTHTYIQVITEQLLERAADPSVALVLLTLARPSLSELFGPDVRHERSQLPLRVAAAVRLGYPLVQIAAQLDVHYTTVSRYLRAAQQGQTSTRRHVPRNSPETMK